MKCPQCLKNEQTSLCFVGNFVKTTAMGGGLLYWDEAGTYHNHDPNRSTGSYHCSRGHRWTIMTRHACPGCDFGHMEPEVKILAEPELNTRE